VIVGYKLYQENTETTVKSCCMIIMLKRTTRGQKKEACGLHSLNVHEETDAARLRQTKVANGSCGLSKSAHTTLDNQVVRAALLLMLQLIAVPEYWHRGWCRILVLTGDRHKLSVS
jgi:hypothetical protein